MFDESKDILFFALATCAVVFTFFVCWALYYVVMMLKRVHGMVNEISLLVASIKEKVERASELFDSVEEKLKHSASMLPLIFKGVTEVVDYVKEKKSKKRIPKKSKAND